MFESSFVSILAGVAVFVLLVRRFLDADRRSLDAIPTIGPTWPLLSYIGAYRYFKDAPGMVQEGYNKFKGSAFKIATFDQWKIVISGPKLIDELRNAPDDVFSFTEAADDGISTEYTLSPNVRTNHYHIPIIRSMFSRHLGPLFPDLLDEIVTAVNDEIAPEGDEWIKLPAMEITRKIVCRVSNRAFVGLPLCRNADYRKLNVQFAVDVMTSAITLKLFPKFMKPLVGSLLRGVPRSIQAAEGHLRPLIEDRLRKMEEHGDDWPDKPNDMLMLLMDIAQGEERSVRNWAIRILVVNFASIHTSSMSFSNALYHLAAEPQYIQPMREEVESVVKELGWTRAAVQKMYKLDSFLKECQRFSGLDCLSLNRKALKPFTFSDGTHVPAGAVISAASRPTHYDEDHYENPEIFDPFRFATMRQEESEAMKHQFVTTGTEYIAFGHGRHACPGRFFAAVELKTMLAHLVVTYDVKLENPGVRPPSFWVGEMCMPNGTAKVMFRKRQI